MIEQLSTGLLDMAKDAVKFFKRKTEQKIPISNFFKKIEKRYNIKLSKDNKDEIIYKLEEQGIINILKSCYGKRYIVIGKYLDF